MQNHEPDAVTQDPRAQGLCREVIELVALSREQRRSIERLLSRLQAVMRTARRQRKAGGAWRSASSQG